MTEPRRTELDATALLCILLCCVLWGINQSATKAVLPEVRETVGAAAPVPTGHALRRHQRYSIKCGAVIQADEARRAATVVELSLHGFQARCEAALPV